MAEPSSPLPRCPDCGTRLSTEVWGENLCPRCLLLLAAPTLDSAGAALSQAPTEVVSEILTSAPTATYPPRVEAGESEPLAFTAGEVLGDRYRVLKLLGRGGMGEVWRAYDLKLRMDVALKALHASVVGSEEGLEVLRGEVRAAREVISPNVCRLFDLIEVDGHELVSMEYIDGETLLELLKGRGPLELQEAREIGSQFLAGLEAIHQADLVHRDIKPENLMLTRSGRVVVMDFGLTSPTGEGDLAGTPAYMAPEQGRGEGTDARADVFSAGMVLAEMLSAERGPEESSRQTFWENVRREPPALPDSPWIRVLLKAVAPAHDERYASAAELARVLEEIAVRVEGAEDKTPYPGLASFTEEAAEFFFGREAEVEAVWKKLQQAYLLGLIGASGSGKSSFINAGFVPAKPEGWDYLKVNPGRAPLAALGRGLLSKLEGDSEALKDLVSLDDPDRAFAALQHWRTRHRQVLLIVDQFEELFTQNSSEAQERFAGLLSRAALDGDVHVLLAMRDDFLLRCHDFESLDPLFSELTPLKPPMGSALRRALTQPALRCGYRFEDEGMVEEMLAEVTKERGALSLIAFTAARLWEERDQDTGFLSREAYDRMGGVGGALAQHAETTLERIGPDKTPIVRELFRNLVTAQGTRAVMEVDEVLSVFGASTNGGEGPAAEDPRLSAADVLQTLIDARLLTSYEVQSEESDRPRRRVELVHESLLTAWPRLVRWRTQDAEGAQLRDELRQAAKLWETRGRSEDLLWTGTAFREFELWRERYPGRLTALEEEYATAMVERAERQRRRRRLAVAAVLVLALAVTAITGTLWRRSETARNQAIAAEREAAAEALRAEASKLLAFGRLEEERYPTAALAYATKSLELADTPEARRLALKVLLQGPPARILPTAPIRGVAHPNFAISPDGQWLATALPETGEVHLFSRDGTLHKVLQPPAHQYPRQVDFGPDSDLLVLHSPLDPVIRIWSVPEGDLIRTIQPEGAYPNSFVKGDQILTFGKLEDDKTQLVQSWPLAGGERRVLGKWKPGELWWQMDVDPTGTWMAYKTGRTVYWLPLEGLDSASPKVLGSHDDEIETLRFSPQGDRLVLRDQSGRVLIWSLEGRSAKPLRVLDSATQNGIFRPRLDPTGSWLAWGSSAERTVYLLDLEGPPDARPLRLGRHDEDRVLQGFFDPQGEWLATRHYDSISFWSLDGAWTRAIPAIQQMYSDLVVSPDSQHLASCHGFEARLWPLIPGKGVGRKIASIGCSSIAAHPARPELLVGSGWEPVVLVSIDDGTERPLPGGPIDEYAGALAFDAEGRRAAMGRAELNQFLRIWSLESGELRDLPIRESPTGRSHGVRDIRFVPDGNLFSAGRGGVRRWDLERGTSTEYYGSEVAQIDLSREGRHLLMTAGERAASNLGRTELLLFDLETDTRHEITTHGNSVQAVAFDPSGRSIVTGGAKGVVRVGPVTGEEPHLFLGHEDHIKAVAVSPDGRWIFSGAGAEIRRWPMPDLSQPPLHTLPLDELLEKLHSLTNLRVVEDPDSPEGWKLEVGPFSG